MRSCGFPSGRFREADEDRIGVHEVALRGGYGFDRAGTGAFKASSIFIASITSSSWPSSTTSPAAARTSTMRPGIGATRCRRTRGSLAGPCVGGSAFERPATALFVVQADARPFHGQGDTPCPARRSGRTRSHRPGVRLPRCTNDPPGEGRNGHRVRARRSHGGIRLPSGRPRACRDGPGAMHRHGPTANAGRPRQRPGRPRRRAGWPWRRRNDRGRPPV